MTTEIRIRRDSEADWTADNPILALGEMGIATDHLTAHGRAARVKVGDGVNAWNALPWSFETAPRDLNAQAAAYTLVAADLGRVVTLSNAGALNLTVPANADVAFPVGATITLYQAGAGQVTIVAAAGVTIRSTPGLKIAAQYGVAELLKLDTNEWVAYGRLSA